MKIFKQKIDEELAKQYCNDAVSAGLDYGLNLTLTDGIVDSLDKLCVKLHSDLRDILADEILLDSIAIKNAAVIYLYLKGQYPNKNVEWYQHDDRYGDNTYPIRFGSYAIFPKQWFKAAILSGKKGELKSLYIDSVNDK